MDVHPVVAVPEEPVQPPRRRRWWWWWVATVGVVAVAGIATLTGLLLTQDAEGPAVATASPAVSASPAVVAGPVGLSEYELCEANEWSDPREYIEWVGRYADAAAVEALEGAVDAYQRDPDDFGAELDLRGAILKVEMSCRESAP